MKANESHGLSWSASLLVTGLICALALLTARMLTPKSSYALNRATQLPCTASQSIEILGNGVVYSDGTSLRALNDGGRQIWSYVVGSSCGFSVGDGGVSGWSGDSLTVLNASNGTALFSAALGEPVLSATAGDSYAAALVGEENSTTLIVLDLGGHEIDRIALTDMTVLDFGFFNNGSMLWIMSLDTNGTVPMSQITTYKPGRMQSGSIVDSEQAIYKVMFDNPSVYAVGTTYIRAYDYTGIENQAGRRLIYGWYLYDSWESGGSAVMAFVPISEVGTQTEINDIRLIHNTVDRTIRMPFPCFSIAVRGTNVYGFSDQHVMIHGLSSTHADTYQLPFVCDGLIGITGGNSVVLVSGDSVYMVSLP